MPRFLANYCGSYGAVKFVPNCAANRVRLRQQCTSSNSAPRIVGDGCGWLSGHDKPASLPPTDGPKPTDAHPAQVGVGPSGHRRREFGDGDLLIQKGSHRSQEPLRLLQLGNVSAAGQDREARVGQPGRQLP